MTLFATPYSYKSFSKILALTTLSVLLIAVAVINLVIDPYNEHGWFSKFSYRSNQTTAFRLFQKLRDKPYTLVFGTSTSAPIDEACVKGDVLNFSLSLYGEPERIYYALRSLSPQQVRNIAKIYYAVEHNVLHANPVTNTDVDFNSKWGFYYRTVRNIQKPKIIACLDCVFKRTSGLADSIITDTGVYRHLRDRPFNAEGYEKHVVFTHEPQQVEYLRKLAEFARDHQIEFVVLRTMVSAEFLKRVDFFSLEQHFDRVLSAVPSFYSLMWVENVSDDLKYFRDPIHPSYAGTRKEMEELLSPRAGSYLVSKANLKEYIATLKSKVRVGASVTSKLSS